ncbi:MAG: PEP-CTERM system TPR-repeat protein PrsT [Paucibacter sp.]|nr:PEP-CTERM system TPR-repeat protein PrsT [Roseateles sp.]
MKMPKSSVRTTAVLVMSAVGILVAGCSRSTPESLIANAQASMERKELNKAEVELKGALQIDPNMAKARFLLGLVLLRRGDVGGASIELEKAGKSGYQGEDLVAAQAQVMLMQGHGDQALKRFSSTQLVNPKASAALDTVLAEAMLRANDQAGARARVDAAIKLDPAAPAVELMDVRLIAIESGPVPALAAVDKVLEKNPDSADAWILKGQLLSTQGRDLQGAADAYRHAIAADKNKVGAYVALCSLLINEDDHDGVKKALDDFKAKFPKNPMQLFFSAGYQMQSGDLNGAHETVQQVLKAAPEDPNVHLLAGRIELLRGNTLEAEGHFDKAALAMPGAPANKLLLATAQLALDETDKAARTIAPMLGVTPPNVEALNLAGDIKLKQHDAAAAEHYFSQALAARPVDIHSRLMLATLQLGKPGQQAEAIQKLRALASEDHGIQADLELIAALAGQGDIAGASAAVDGLEKKTPGQPNPAFIRGTLELQRGDKTKARAFFEEALKRSPVFMPALQALVALDLQDQRLPSAIGRYEAFLRVAPSKAEAVLGLVELKQRAGASSGDIKKILNDGIRSNPAAGILRAALARLLLQEGDSRGALSAVQEALAQQPDDVELLGLEAQVSLALGDSNRAATDLGRIVSLTPGSAVPLIRLAQFQAVQKDWPGAVDSLKRAQAIAPHDLNVQFSLVHALTAAGRTDEARKLALGVQRSDAKSPAGYVLEAEIDVAARQYTPAVAAYRAALDKVPSGETAVALFKTLQLSGDTAGAGTFQANWLKSHPKDTTLISYLGDQALHAGDKGEALKRYQAVLDIQPDNALAMNNVAWLISQDKPKVALEMSEKVNQLYPNQPAFMDTKAAILVANGKLDAALELQRRLVDMNPDVAAHRLHLAQYLIQSGKKSEARTELDKMASMNGGAGFQDEVKKLQASL